MSWLVKNPVYNNCNNSQNVKKSMKIKLKLLIIQWQMKILRGTKSRFVAGIGGSNHIGKVLSFHSSQSMT